MSNDVMVKTKVAIKTKIAIGVAALGMFGLAAYGFGFVPSPFGDESESASYTKKLCMANCETNRQECINSQDYATGQCESTYQICLQPCYTLPGEQLNQPTPQTLPAPASPARGSSTSSRSDERREESTRAEERQIPSVEGSIRQCGDGCDYEYRYCIANSPDLPCLDTFMSCKVECRRQPLSSTRSEYATSTQATTTRDEVTSTSEVTTSTNGLFW